MDFRSPTTYGPLDHIGDFVLLALSWSLVRPEHDMSCSNSATQAVSAALCMLGDWWFNSWIEAMTKLHMSRIFKEVEAGNFCCNKWQCHEYVNQIHQGYGHKFWGCSRHNPSIPVYINKLEEKINNSCTFVFLSWYDELQKTLGWSSYDQVYDEIRHMIRSLKNRHIVLMRREGRQESF